mgnify:CR=1 FL=1
MKKEFDILFTGKLKTAIDGTTLQQGDFQVLKNMRYGETYPRSISGMTKINTTVTPEINIKNGLHFHKTNESHVLVWANGNVYKNDTAIPSAGDFTVTPLYTDGTGFSTGRFALAPDDAMIYCNGVESRIWGGDEFRCATFYILTQNKTEIINDSSTATTISFLANEFYIATTRPINQIKFYVGVANTTAATMNVQYWNGTAWTNCAAQSDGTAVAGKTLAQTGAITFTSTATTAIIKNQYSTLAYWYKMTTSATPHSTTTVYQVTVNAPVEFITNLWDGLFHNISNFTNATPTVVAETSQVFSEDYVASLTYTFADIGGMLNTEHFYVGSFHPLQGINIIIGSGNTLASTLTVDYFNTTSGLWTALTSIVDNTSESSKTLKQSGLITWNSNSAEGLTFISNEYLYYYRFNVSQTLSATVHIDQIQAIYTQDTISNYSFPVYWNNRVGLCNNTTNYKNRILLGAINTNCIFEGYDTATLDFGDNTDLLAATELYIRDTSIFSNLLVLKKNETWLVDGVVPANFVIYNISKTIGITAPLTLQACGIGTTGLLPIPRHIAIWQSSNAIVLFDGNVIVPISEDIKNLFDQNSSDHINTSYSNISAAFFDPSFNEYHWLFADSTSSTINREMVYDIVKHKWYEVDRGTGKKLQCGIPVIDTIGNIYTYGGLATGYCERLENSTTFDGNNIVSTLKTGDIAFKGWGYQNLLRHIKLLAKSKANTTNTVTITHFKDTETTGTSLGSASLTSSTKRIVQNKFSINKGDNVFHAFQLQLTTDNEVNALEPIGIQAFVEDIREDT